MSDLKHEAVKGRDKGRTFFVFMFLCMEHVLLIFTDIPCHLNFSITSQSHSLSRAPASRDITSIHSQLLEVTRTCPIPPVSQNNKLLSCSRSHLWLPASDGLMLELELVSIVSYTICHAHSNSRQTIQFLAFLPLFFLLVCI